MRIDPRTPVLVGVHAVTQRRDDPAEADDALGLMAAATRAAARDAGAPGLLADVGWVGVPDGTWAWTDPGRLLAEGCGLGAARPTGRPTTALAEIGVLQQELLTRACALVASGAADATLVVGGEARYRAQQAGRRGVEVADTPQAADARPDQQLAAASLGIADVEIERDLVSPVVAYAVIEQAFAHASGWSGEVHRRRLGALWESFARVAAHNTDAWDRSAPDATRILTPGEGNRMLAVPYTRRLVSQWNVDQAAAVLVCSVETARRHGVPEDRWVFPWAATQCDHSVPVVQRAELHRSPGAAVAGARLFELAGVGSAEVGPIDLYSCFPSAVQVVATELDLPLAPAPTVTGGMTFAGGPLNNYVLQALVRLVDALRRAPGDVGLSSSISGQLTKQGFSLWSTTPPAGGFRSADVTAEVAAVDRPRPLAADREGEAVVVAATVDHRGLEPRAVAVCAFPDGARTVGVSTDPAVCAAVVADDAVGRAVGLGPGGELRVV